VEEENRTDTGELKVSELVQFSIASGMRHVCGMP
jgi:hypothetical protein